MGCGLVNYRMACPVSARYLKKKLCYLMDYDYMNELKG